MDPKRELTSVDLVALVGELGAYEGAKLDKAYLYEDGLVRLKLRDFERGRVELLVEVGDRKRAHVAAPEHVPDAPGRPPNFAMMLRNRLSGADFAGVEQFEFDRILSLSFERDDQDTTLVAELFGEGNVAVLDENGVVVDSLDTVRLKSRTVAPGARYEFPQTRFNPLTADEEGFAARMEESDTDLVRTLATQLNFGGLYAEELCTRAGVEKTKAIADADREEYDALYSAWERFLASLRGGLDPRLYRVDGDPVDVTPLPMEERADLESETFETFNGAVDAYFVARDEAETEAGGGGGGRDRPDFEAEIEKRKRIIDQQEGAIEEYAAQAEAERAKAESLYANYDLVDDILSTVREAREAGHAWDEIGERFAAGADRGIAAAEAVEGVDGSEGTVTVDLDGRPVTLRVDQGVEQNADRLYQEAKRIGEKCEGAEEAIEETRRELAHAERRREEWTEGGGEPDEDEGSEDEPVDWLAEPSVPVRQNEQWYERFRWFETSDGFLVIGGRNADQNEDLVKKYVEKGDLVFHTQAHGGPVTVLKATGPSEPSREVDVPEQSQEEAAQFAVSYSTVWKDGQFSDDVYMVSHDQVSKTPESGEYLEKGGFAVRGDRTYFRDTPVGVAVGIVVEPESRVVGGPPAAIRSRAVTTISVEPGQYAQNDAAKMLYREFRERFADTSFVRKVASPDRIQEFLPPGGSRIVEE